MKEITQKLLALGFIINPLTWIVFMGAMGLASFYQILRDNIFER